MTSPALTLVADDDLSLARRLAAKIDQGQEGLHKLDRYYEGRQPLQFLAPEVRGQIGDRLAPLVINWPRTILDSVQRRCYVEGFRVGGAGEADDDLWRLWQQSDMDEWSQLGQADALVHARSYLSAWTDWETREPRLTVESAHQVAVAYAPGTRHVRAALKSWNDDDGRFAVLFLPDRVVRYFTPQRSLTVNGSDLIGGLSGASWLVDEILPNPLGAVPIVPLVNRPRLLNLDGESELTDVIPLADAVNKLATDMMVTSEFHATKRRYATGIEIPAGEQRDRLQAEVEQYWDNATKNKTWLAGPGVTFGEFQEATLGNFTGAIAMLTGQIAAIAGLPPHYLGVNGDNPASADAIRSAESTLVERAREKHRTWGGAYERAMRLLVAVRDGVRFDAVAPDLAGMETIWRDPQTPTVAQSADAAVKLVESEIIDDVQAQENVGLSPAQREAIAARREARAATAATADVRARIELARELQRTDGLSVNASYAAVGLLAAASANAADAQP